MHLIGFAIAPSFETRFAGRPGLERHRMKTNLCRVVLLCLISWATRHDAFGLGRPPFIDLTNSTGSFCLVSNGVAAGICVAVDDYAGVIRAAEDLRSDISRVSGVMPLLCKVAPKAGSAPILVGTLGRSAVLGQLVREGKLAVNEIQGKWESYIIATVSNAVPGVDCALVVAGNDKRGTIYGVYELSEQMGVSPWYWWADVPVQHRDRLYVKAGRYVQGSPAVRYRGIFLNDEAPCLTGWVKEKFGNYNHRFYTNVFELLLRLRANYLWPAMWNNCFNEDDPLNPKLADEYGIVMGTSHVEPMMRADKEWNRQGNTAAEWNYDKNPELLRRFWTEGLERNKNYENIITLAMRGKIDTPMSETANIALLERIVGDQRKIIEQVTHTNAASVPQLWALYKEVQEYYEKGMRVPDDVTLLWCDDNWGNLRRLPTAEERRRSGGAGIYYHFDYVGGPRNYKWLNTVPITKVWEQMNLAYRYGADRIWIVNVGDLKPMEFPMEFFLTFAWSPDQWPKERIADYGRLWATREFGPEHAADIAELVAQYTKFNGRRKPELLEPETFSLPHYQEADKIVAEWTNLTQKADEVYAQLSANARDAFYELALHPTKACAVVNELYVAVARNRLYSRQGRASATDYAERARELFRQDAELSDYFNHKLAGGKWSHMMDQTHIGYTYWQQPNSNALPKLAAGPVPDAAGLGLAPEGSGAAWPTSTNELTLPVFDSFTQAPHFVDVFNRSRTGFEFTVTPSAPWLVLSVTNGTIEKEKRLWISIDWNKAPKGSNSGLVRVSRTAAESATVRVTVFNPSDPSRESLNGFVESDGCVSIEAAHFTEKTDTAAARWEPVPDLGLTASSMSIFPVTAPSVTPPENSPRLDYHMYLFSTGAVEVTSVLAPCLNFAPDRGVRLAVAFDEEAPQVLTVVPKGYFVDNGNRDWEESVKNNARKAKSRHTIAQAGYHTLKVWMVDPGVVLERLVVDLGGVKPSYLGPPESFHCGTSDRGDAAHVNHH
jgi:hypothetical protein